MFGVEESIRYKATVLYISLMCLSPKECEKKSSQLIFLKKFPLFEYFFTKIHRDIPYFIRKQYVNIESVIIIKSEEILFFLYYLNNVLGPYEFSYVENCDSYQKICKIKMAGMC